MRGCWRRCFFNRLRRCGARVHTHEEFKKILGEKPLGIFVRSILGLDINAAREAFSSFLSNGPLSSVQIEFVKDLINQLTQNGKIDPEMLFDAPFTKFHEQGVAGVFSLNDAEKVIEMVKEVNGRAVAG
ncbi:type I restriction-modification enzyme R subunit C-terminal domain-containing protein [Dyadobacter subterraneus]|uniref:EcoEI R protein C-terminal domain-containing protein n=1 Tax=Dyadobacter subterraneus TaxID=2773304 RepID=A0ABR9WB66_9BACT|nr:type I restriction-modification enzyme R subunit C-terminal domain-containing protein [Dyadobacter subterraneus]MBE9462226.1 hypothetical protein [Dyadobacter subterraneus]